MVMLVIWDAIAPIMSSLSCEDALSVSLYLRWYHCYCKRERYNCLQLGIIHQISMKLRYVKVILSEAPKVWYQWYYWKHSSYHFIVMILDIADFVGGGSDNDVSRQPPVCPVAGVTTFSFQWITFFFFFLALRHKAPQINEEQPTGVRCRPPHLDALHVIPNYQKCLFPYLCLVFTVLFHSHQVTRPWKQAEINNFDKNKSQSSRLVPTFHRVDRHHRQKKGPLPPGTPTYT